MGGGIQRNSSINVFLISLILPACKCLFSDLPSSLQEREKSGAYRQCQQTPRHIAKVELRFLNTVEKQPLFLQSKHWINSTTTTLKQILADHIWSSYTATKFMQTQDRPVHIRLLLSTPVLAFPSFPVRSFLLCDYCSSSVGWSCSMFVINLPGDKALSPVLTPSL